MQTYQSLAAFGFSQHQLVVASANEANSTPALSECGRNASGEAFSGSTHGDTAPKLYFQRRPVSAYSNRIFKQFGVRPLAALYRKATGDSDDAAEAKA